MTTRIVVPDTTPDAPDSLEYSFPVAVTEWTANHGKGIFPEVLVFDTLGRRGEPWLIEYPDTNTVLVRHLNPMSGSMVLNF